MPEQCDICGVAALESEHFAEERLPFRGARRYCPACRQRFYRRLYALLALLPLLAGGTGMVYALHQHQNVLESLPVQWCLLFLFQWLMILPHELGHAAAARAFGFNHIRMLIGGGKPLFSFELLGIPTLVNLIPIGGATLSKQPADVSRWRYLVFAGAGLLVNFTAAAIAASVAAPGELFNLHAGGLVAPFFWANVLVLAENLLPHQVQTAFGPLRSDGLLIWNLLLQWNQPPQVEPRRQPALGIVLRHLLKWTGFLLMLVAMLFWGVVAAMVLLKPDDSLGWGSRLLLSALMLLLALVTGWAAVRIANHPVPAVTGPSLPAEERNLSALGPERLNLLKLALERAQAKDFAAAEALLDQSLADVPETSVPGYWTLLLLKMEFLVSQNDMARAERLCLDGVDRAATTEQKVRLLDGLVCQILYKSIAAYWETAERLVRQALALAPGTLTLKGSLGGVLVEQGRFAEAEPLLRECLERSPALHDQGISAFYLGMAKLRTGDHKEAKHLLKRAMVLHAEPWLLAKAGALLKELEH